MRKTTTLFLIGPFGIAPFLLAALFFCSRTFAQDHITQSINTNWQFHRGDLASDDKSGWEKVSLPHSWNTEDVYDDIPGYYRGVGWYKKTIYIPAAWKDKNIYLYFEGANQVTQLFVNGQPAGKHSGGYTAFRFRIDPYLQQGNRSVTSPRANDNLAAQGNGSLTAAEIMVKVDNGNNPDIPPLSADFTFYGGIYRDVYIEALNPVHFDMDDHASPGVRIRTPRVSGDQATVVTSASVRVSSGKGLSLKITNDIIDARGNGISHAERMADAGQPDYDMTQTVSAPHLWSPDSPYLYRVDTKLINAKTNEVLDEQSSPLGLRWFAFDPGKGFFLNGKPLKLIGASRHQDYSHMANALPNTRHELDMELLKQMGANFIRIAHYPQDPAVLEACDRLGLLASVEIPIVNEISESQVFTDNCLEMQTEMIRQNFNHPSVIIWAYMNEVLLHPHFEHGSELQKTYFSNVVTLARRIDSLSHKEDSSRYTMIPCHGDFTLYTSTGLAKIPGIVGWNLYSGWYGAGLEGFDKFLDRHHAELPDKPLIITEYGADADSRSHSLRPERFDKSVEYQRIFHAHYLKAIMDRPFVSGAALWNLADFNAEGRGESTPHINTKGITTDERAPKETYFLYQAHLLKTPFLRLGGNQWLLRSGITSADGTCSQPVTVFSNQPLVRLWLNGKLIGESRVNECMATFDVPFVNGINVLTAAAGPLTSASGTATAPPLEDKQTVTFKMLPARLADTSFLFSELNVSLGDRRYFVDDWSQQVWLPDQPYTKGGWGYLDGEEYHMKDSGRLPFGSDKAILGTTMGAIYETQRIGLSGFKADVPDGFYEVTLHFAELEAKRTTEALIYNLGGSAAEAGKTRSFDVSVNGRLLLEGLSNSNYLQPQMAYSTTTKVIVHDGKGIFISFRPVQGQPILNAVQIRRIY